MFGHPKTDTTTARKTSLVVSAFAPILLGAVVGLAPACRRSPDTRTPAEVQAALQKAFKEGDAGARKMAEEVVTAVRQQEPSKAFTELYNLSSNPTLTPEQRAVAAESMAAVGKQLRDAAANGDSEAAKTLEAYRVGK